MDIVFQWLLLSYRQQSCTAYNENVLHFMMIASSADALEEKAEALKQIIDSV